mmetsp:Transcript_7898/g.19203  ORF Transcript_7898/g.19203 Transcript_7898/m.19203 type:complete len:683 (-) Transcript_7898:113-2161(-)
MSTLRGADVSRTSRSSTMSVLPDMASTIYPATSSTHPCTRSASATPARHPDPSPPFPRKGTASSFSASASASASASHSCPSFTCWRSARAKMHPDPSSTSLRTLLDGAHAEGRRRAVATRAPLLGAAAVFIVVGLWFYLHRRLTDAQNSSVWCMPLSGAFLATGCYLSICSVLPADRLMPYALCFIFLVLVLIFGISDGSKLTGYWADARAICAGELTDEQRAPGASADDCPFSYVNFGTILGDLCVALIVTARSLRVLVPTLCYGLRPREVRISAINSGRFAMLSFTINFFVRDTIVNLLRASHQQPWHLGVVIRDCYNLLLGAVVMSPWGIRKVQRWLMTRGEAVSSAAMVASIIGSRPVEELHARGLSTLRGVSMDQLKLEHLRAPNRPKKAKTPVLNRRGGGVIREGSSVALQLSQKIRLQTPAATLVPALLTSVTPRAELLASASRPAKFGCVDAFISHSWLDDPRAKWDALQTWRSDFVAQYRREPIIWMDRLCIDQKAITESLPLLPVYLAGCNSLLILAGPTYLQRLWCWVEIFVWLEIGGDSRETVIYPLADFSLADEMDVRHATCYLPEDTDRLLSTVDASTLHGVEGFNGRVRSLFAREFQHDASSSPLVKNASSSFRSRTESSLRTFRPPSPVRLGSNVPPTSDLGQLSSSVLGPDGQLSSSALEPTCVL